MERIYKYYPDDFGELSVRVEHMDLLFDVYDDHTFVRSDLKVRTFDKPLKVLELNCRNLEVHSVSCDIMEVEYDYRKEDAILEVQFHSPVSPDTELVITTETTCRPTKNILEGLYYDESPAGAPPQQITQCQQWGFQRIVPCIDDMTAKCTYTTTIIADERYTNLISNGDVVEPLHSIGDGRVRIVYDNSTTPMATYLFFLGAGTYQTFTREFEYPDGHTFDLELLVPPGSKVSEAQRALDILYDAVMWVYLFTGKEQYKDVDTRKKILELVRQRDLLKAEDAGYELEEVRDELRALNDSIHPGYKYTGTVYREIGMQNSDFGGMENVGNTTITTNRIMPRKYTTDPSFEYMIRVKVHEYYHNINGSEVTGWSPFEIWLNEAVTVHLEQHYFAYLFGEDYARLSTVLDLLAPGIGTFALDSGAASMSIVPEGFNDPNDLITAVTYVKAPEFVRMLETLMGKETFSRALDSYHRKFSHSNAKGEDWVHEMETVSNLKLKDMAGTWLSQTGFPKVHLCEEYDPAAKVFTLKLHQDVPQGYRPWEFPFIVALVDEQGNDISQVMERVREEDTTIVIEDVPRPAFVSLNRGYSFYGKVIREASDEELLLQVRKDGDLINRFLAYYKLMDREKMRLLKDPEAAVSETIVELFFELISDEKLMQEAGGQFMTIFENVEDEKLSHHYKALYDVKQRILNAIATEKTVGMLNIYHGYNKISSPSDETLAEMSRAIKARQVKNIALRVLSTLDTEKVHLLCREQFDKAVCATDRLVAFDCYVNSSAEDKSELLNAFMEESARDLVAWEAFLSIAGSISSEDGISIIRDIETSDTFRIEQANDQRALYGSFSRNRKISMQTGPGRQLLKEILLKLSVVNEYSTTRSLNIFGDLDRMQPEYHVPLVSILAEMLDKLDKDEVPGVYNRVRKLLRAAPEALKNYGKEYGQIKGL